MSNTMARQRDYRTLVLVLLLVMLMMLSSTVLAASRVFRVQEGDLVKIKIEATDVDKDTIFFTYPAPLNRRGEWQTTDADAGEYELNITASDGVQKTVETVILIVENTNQPPIITDKEISIKEQQTLDLKTLITDSDGDAIQYHFDPPFDTEGIWQPGYDDAGNYITTVTASDGEFTKEFRVGVNVVNTDRPLALLDSFSKETSFSINENETLSYWIDVVKEKSDHLTYRWELDNTHLGEGAQGEEAQGEHDFDFDFASAGDHTLRVTVDNGRGNLVQEWKIVVKNVNRAPELRVSSITMNEGEKIILDLPEKDLDGDEVTYAFSGLFDEKGTWQPRYDQAGTYPITITASDGQLQDQATFVITVLEVDRAPTLKLPTAVEVWEGGELPLKIETEDPDDDPLQVSFTGLPGTSSYDADSKTLLIQPGYDVVTRKGGLFSNVLNRLRIEQFFLRTKTIPITIRSCGRTLCTESTIKIIIHNTDRPPVFRGPSSATISETEELTVQPDAVDPDGDIVRYYFTEPLRKKSGTWKTDYNDEGIYTSYVTATDGKEQTTIPFTIQVQKKNRFPSITPPADEITANEGEEIVFTVSASDPDHDNLMVTLENSSAGMSFQESTFRWTPPFNLVNKNGEAGNKSKVLATFAYFNTKFAEKQEVVWLQFVVTDGEVDVVHPVKVTVKDVNQPPEMMDSRPSQDQVVKTNQPVLFHVAAKDSDDDALTYSWSFGLGEEGVVGTDTIRKTFTTPGSKNVRVIMSDGQDSVVKEWAVQVEQEQFIPLPVPDVKPTFKVYVVEG